MGDPRTGQKKVTADEVFVGDLIFRTSKERGDLMMKVQTKHKGVKEGIDVYVLRGEVYKLTGDGAGPEAAFLGSMSGDLAGRGEWYLPLDGHVHKGAIAAEADYQFPITAQDDDR